jgi:Tfp pilus assembly protein PilO
MTMNNPRFATLLAVLVVVALVAGTWFLGIAPRLAEAATANTDRETVEAQNRAHQAELDRLLELNDRLPELQAELAEIRTAIPGDADAARFYPRA